MHTSYLILYCQQLYTLILQLVHRIYTGLAKIDGAFSCRPYCVGGIGSVFLSYRLSCLQKTIAATNFRQFRTEFSETFAHRFSRLCGRIQSDNVRLQNHSINLLILLLLLLLLLLLDSVTRSSCRLS